MIMNIAFANARKGGFVSIRGEIVGTNKAGELLLVETPALRALVNFTSGSKDDPSPAITMNRLPRIELSDAHFRLANTQRSYEDELGVSKLDTLGDLPVHHIGTVPGAPDSPAWKIIASIERRPPVKGTEPTPEELAKLLNG